MRLDSGHEVNDSGGKQFRDQFRIRQQLGPAAQVQNGLRLVLQKFNGQCRHGVTLQFWFSEGQGSQWQGAKAAIQSGRQITNGTRLGEGICLAWLQRERTDRGRSPSAARRK